MSDDGTWDHMDKDEIAARLEAVMRHPSTMRNNDEINPHKTAPPGSPVIAALIMSETEAQRFCELACSGDYDSIPYLLDVAQGLAAVAHKILEGRGLDPHGHG